MTIEIYRNPNPSDINAIKTGLIGFNREFGTEDYVNPLVVFAKDELGRSVGGAMFCIQYTSCYIHLFWLEADSRGKG